MSIVTARVLRILKGESRLPLHYYLLAPLSWLYAAASVVRAALYGLGVIKVRSLPCKVIAVGNLTAGGTGKTPAVIYIANLLASKGKNTAVVIRGYRGGAKGRVAVVSDGKDLLMEAGMAGDEACLLAKNLPGVPVVIGGDRYEAGMLAIKSFNPDVIILDDAYQHIALKRDLNILLMDARRPFGNGFTLPMGYLREPKSAVKRADLAVLTRSDRASEPELADSAAKISSFAHGLPVIMAAHRPRTLYSLWGKGETALEYLGGKGVVTASGVAEPASFALILEKLNAKITQVFEYPDHHGYTTDDVAEMEAAAVKAGAFAVVTTEKDAVKLAGRKAAGVEFLVLGIGLEITRGAETLDALIADKIIHGQ